MGQEGEGRERGKRERERGRKVRSGARGGENFRRTEVVGEKESEEEEEG